MHILLLYDMSIIRDIDYFSDTFFIVFCNAVWSGGIQKLLNYVWNQNIVIVIVVFWYPWGFCS